MSKGLQTFLALSIVPSLAGFVLAGHYFTRVFLRPTLTDDPSGDISAAAMASMTLVISAVLVLFIVLLFKADHRKSRLLEDHRSLETNLQRTSTQLRHLREEVDLLAGLREMTRVVNREQSFTKIIEELFPIIHGLTDADEIVLYLNPEESDFRLSPRAQFKDQKTLFGSDIDHSSLNASLAEKASNAHAQKSSASGDRLEFALPFLVDDQTLGVVSVTRRIDETIAEDKRWMRFYERSLRSILSHMALAVRNPALYDRAMIDALTQLYTKRNFTGALDKAFKDYVRDGNQTSLIMVDIDKFKSVNDECGHLAGDHILAGVASRILANVDGDDIRAYRYGGEEIAIICRNILLKEATELAETIRKAIESEQFELHDESKLNVTASLGVASFDPTMRTKDSIVEAADAVLYEAKRNGRNQTRAHKKSLLQAMNQRKTTKKRSAA
ncbi:MAG: GGDEF domain-containing protein [Planctomycetes bacterium]|nr:GGDEF domain-containing protein [Planctomycetota bacterium]